MPILFKNVHIVDIKMILSLFAKILLGLSICICFYNAWVMDCLNFIAIAPIVFEIKAEIFKTQFPSFKISIHIQQNYVSPKSYPDNFDPSGCTLIDESASQKFFSYIHI